MAPNRSIHQEKTLAVQFDDVIYKIVTSEQWRAAKEKGVFNGAPVDLKDGYIHFSTAKQLRETAAKHFAGQDDLLLVSVSSSSMTAKLVYEPSRGGQLFPHLYGALLLSAVIETVELPLGADGQHQFSDGIA